MQKKYIVLAISIFILLILISASFINKEVNNKEANNDNDRTTLSDVARPTKGFEQSFLSVFEKIVPPPIKQGAQAVNKFIQNTPQIGSAQQQNQKYLSLQSPTQPAITEEQIFNILYPPDYIKSIADMQNRLAGAGLLESSTKIDNINTEEKVIAALNNNIEALGAGGYFNALEIIDLKYHLYNTFKNIKADERQAILKNPQNYIGQESASANMPASNNLRARLLTLLGIRADLAHAQSIPISANVDYQNLLTQMAGQLLSQTRANTGIPVSVSNTELARVLNGTTISNPNSALQAMAQTLISRVLQNTGAAGNISIPQAGQVISGVSAPQSPQALQGIANQMISQALGNLGVGGQISIPQAGQVLSGGNAPNVQGLLNTAGNQIIQSGLSELGLRGINPQQILNILNGNVSNPQELLNTAIGAGINYGLGQNGITANLNAGQIATIVKSIQNPEQFLNTLAGNVINAGLAKYGLGGMANVGQIQQIFTGGLQNPQSMFSGLLNGALGQVMGQAGIGGVPVGNLSGMLNGTISNPQQLFSTILNGGLTQVMDQAGMGGIPIGNLSGMLNGTISNPQQLFSSILNGGLSQVMGQAGMGGIPIGNLSGMLNGTIANPQGLLQSALGSVLGKQLNLAGLGGLLSAGQATGILTGSPAPQGLLNGILGNTVGKILNPLGAGTLQSQTLGQLALAGPTLSSVQGTLERIAGQAFQTVLPQAPQGQLLGALTGGATGLPLSGLGGKECYREGSTNKITGSNSFVLYCNAGCVPAFGINDPRCGAPNHKFLDNCDPSGKTTNPTSICDIPLGCLNLICPAQPAIWDPQSKMCGCSI